MNSNFRFRARMATVPSLRALSITTSECALRRQAQFRFAYDSPLEGDGFEPSVPPSKRRPSSGGPRPTTVVSRDERCLMTPSSLSVRYLRSATAKRPFRKSGTDCSNPVPSSGESTNFRSIETTAGGAVLRSGREQMWTSAPPPLLLSCAGDGTYRLRAGT